MRKALLMAKLSHDTSLHKPGHRGQLTGKKTLLQRSPDSEQSLVQGHITQIRWWYQGLNPDAKAQLVWPPGPGHSYSIPAPSLVAGVG